MSRYYRLPLNDPTIIVSVVENPELSLLALAYSIRERGDGRIQISRLRQESKYFLLLLLKLAPSSLYIAADIPLFRVHAIFLLLAHSNSVRRN